MKKAKQKFTRLRERLAKKKRLYLKMRPHRSFRKTPKSHMPTPVIDSVKTVALATFGIIWREKKLLGGLALIYIITTYMVVGGIAQSDFVSLREATLQVFGGNVNSIGTAVTLFTSTMTGAFNNAELNELQQFLSLLISILLWLALVWTLRMRFADKQITIRDALYNSGAPFISYLIVGFFIILQLTPAALGLIVFNTAQGGGWLQGGVEVMLFTLGAILLGALSFYWLAGSLLALIIVTLPQMYPWRAIQMAGELVIGRRLRIMLHMIALGMILFLAWVVVLLPAIMIDGALRIEWLPLVPLAVQVMGAFTLVYAAAYVYKLYRSFI